MSVCVCVTAGGSQHDSGTAGHEPDSLEAMHTVLTEEPSPAAAAATRRSAGPSPHSVELEPAVLLHLERCAHRKTRRQLQLLQNGVRSVTGRRQVSRRTASGQSRDWSRSVARWDQASHKTTAS